MDSSGLAGFAILVSIGSFILGAVVIIVFFVMASNIGGIARKVNAAVWALDEIKNKLDRIATALEKLTKEKV
ncbi:MAG TPA: hypothetical protein VF490_02695 [Chryseosolibacter sp.]